MSYVPKNPNGQATMANSTPVVIASDQTAVPTTIASLPLPSGASTSAKQDSLLTELQLKADLTETQPVSLASVPSHAVTNTGTFPVQSTLAAETTKVIGTVNQGTTPWVTANAPRASKLQQQTVITASTSETTVLTAVASTFLDVYGAIVANSSATATNVTFKDATTGTTRFNIYVPAGDTRGFMLPMDAAHTQTAVNNNWTATSSVSVTSLSITMLAVKTV